MDPIDYYEELCKWFYESSISRKDEITKGMPLPVAVISVLGGVAAFFIKSGHLFEANVWCGFLTVSTVIIAVGVFWSSTHLIWALFVGKYAYISFANDIDRYLKQLLEYYSLGSLDNSSWVPAIRKLKQVLIKQYVRASSVNMQRNINKSARISRSYWGIWVALIGLVGCLISYMKITVWP